MLKIPPTGFRAWSSNDEPGYIAFQHRLNARLRISVEERGPLFQAAVDGLAEIYLASFPLRERQYHNCQACKSFLNKFGGLVTIDDEGNTRSALWNPEEAEEGSYHVIAQLKRQVEGVPVRGPFYCSEPVWGDVITPSTTWRHFAIVPPRELIHHSKVQTAGQLMAEKREDARNVRRALEEFSPQLLETALTILQSETLYRSEKVLGPAEWLYNLQMAVRTTRSRENRTNLVWKAVALAPAGFCHPRASMIGTLLEDLKAGYALPEVTKRFAAKMHPLQYQRPQAPPKQGTIDQAEKLVDQLGIRESLARRYARIEELECIWRPFVKDPPSTGVFAHLKPKQPINQGQILRLSGGLITFEKFARVVLPGADKVELKAPSVGAYGGFLTAVNPEAPCLMQWDNHFSWYVYVNGSHAEDFALRAGTYYELSGISLKPPHWERSNHLSHMGKGVMFVLPLAKDSRMAGIGLFPEILKSELHGVRSVIEAYSLKAKLEGAREASAFGLIYTAEQKGRNDIELRVTVKGIPTVYTLDRWD